MNKLKKRRNRRAANLIATFIPAIGAERHAWLTGFCARLPEFASQLGLTTAKARSRIRALRPQFMKTNQQPSTP